MLPSEVEVNEIFGISDHKNLGLEPKNQRTKDCDMSNTNQDIHFFFNLAAILDTILNILISTSVAMWHSLDLESMTQKTYR